ncbi:MAG: dTDP-4-dehydrorhamnose 3,5-epimerase family protein [Pseudomonadota bacterium]
MSARFTLTPTAIAGVTLVERHPVGDARGSLTRLFAQDTFAALGFPAGPVEINHTHTATKGTVRGLHLQRPPALEAKLVLCLSGAIFDVAVDLRAGSPTYGRWTHAELSAANHCALLIPPGCAHGFQTLTEDTALLYLHSAPYTPSAEDGVHHASPDLAVRWPLPVALTSERDAALPPFGPAFRPVKTDPAP